MTNGAIRHTKTGLTLASDGKIYSPTGSAIIIGEAPLDIYSQEQADISNPTISGTHNVSTWRWTGEAPFSELKEDRKSVV